MAELLYPSHYPKDSEDGGWSVPGGLYPSHRQNPGLPDMAMTMNASEEVSGQAGDDVLDGGGAPAESGGGFWDRLGDWAGPREAEAAEQANFYPYPVNGSEEEKLEHLTPILYQETAGLRPQPTDPQLKEYGRDQWHPDSYEDLQNARSHMAIVAMRNPNVGKYDPAEKGPMRQDIMDDCRKAAKDALETAEYLPEEVQNFYLQKEGVPVKRTIKWAQDDSIFDTFGPFKSYGGDISHGDNAIIRLHEKKR